MIGVWKSGLTGDPWNLMRQIPSLGQQPFANGKPGEKPCRISFARICQDIATLDLLIDYRYRLIVFREVRLAAHPDPGRASKPELRNARCRGGSDTGHPDFFLAREHLRRRFPRRLGRISRVRRVRSCTRQVQWAMFVSRPARGTCSHKEKGRRDKRAATRRV